jgi:two-component system nitrogen regulation sensor histidine kinase NtrY
MPAPDPKPTSLHKIIDDVYMLYINQDPSIKIEKSYDPNLHLVNIDAEHFRRLFINLFENAIDALNGNLGEERKISITTHLAPANQRLRIEFSDNGMGIPQSDRDKLFRPHFTTKKRGAGLGLAIVNRTVVDHNGTITVRENTPSGTVFEIELPYPPASLKPDSLSKTQSPKTSSPFQIT